MSDYILWGIIHDLKCRFYTAKFNKRRYNKDKVKIDMVLQILNALEDEYIEKCKNSHDLPVQVVAFSDRRKSNERTANRGVIK